LNETDQSMYIQKLMSRGDGLLHLLYSDASRLLMSVANDFPEIAKVQSIGQSIEGRDILVLELAMEKREDQGSSKPSSPAQNNPSSPTPPSSENVLLECASWDDSLCPEAKAAPGSLGHQVLAETNVMAGGQKPSILLTGATHAREMISTSMVANEMLKLIQLGYM